jgi:hypothetical protein
MYCLLIQEFILIFSTFGQLLFIGICLITAITFILIIWRDSLNLLEKRLMESSLHEYLHIFG